MRKAFENPLKIFKKSVKAQKTAFEDPLKKINPKVQSTPKSTKNDQKSKKDFHICVEISKIG
ncbi:hypothetical protein predicted by Glimmer/Critica [Bartonella tribocorum CIP 105476]|uniref:Uncharacterized protein n=1 Tax=Bartonella tribocorum (strain DSM 28219 / CCUG 45778 / CIP 105476 / IBS 506) TaxID=382640 RepID=A9IV86_BART1|nr:hypothetical protein predicted by Glimmer/Critica [Bartonella tribocorum CIP 105476]